MYESCPFTYKSTSNGSKTEKLIKQPSLNLPVLLVPKFSGDYDDFPSFSSSFKSIFFNFSDLTDVQKLFYLKSSVKGDTLKLIQDVELIEENFQMAWELLEKIYKNYNILIQKHVKTMLNMLKLKRHRHLYSEI